MRTALYALYEQLMRRFKWKPRPPSSHSNGLEPAFGYALPIGRMSSGDTPVLAMSVGAEEVNMRRTGPFPYLYIAISRLSITSFKRRVAPRAKPDLSSCRLAVDGSAVWPDHPGHRWGQRCSGCAGGAFQRISKTRAKSHVSTNILGNPWST